MPVLLFLFMVVVGVLIDMLAALLITVVAPYTGIAALDAMDFWQVFATVIVVNIFLWPTLLKNQF